MLYRSLFLHIQSACTVTGAGYSTATDNMFILTTSWEIYGDNKDNTRMQTVLCKSNKPSRQDVIRGIVYNVGRAKKASMYTDSEGLCRNLVLLGSWRD